MLDPASAGLVATGLLVGLVSALTPFLPVEAYVISVGATHPAPVALGAGVTAAVGQTVGKIIIFASARTAGRSRWLRRLRGRGAEAAARATSPPAPDPGDGTEEPVARLAVLTVPDPPHRGRRWRPRWAARAGVVVGRRLARWNARGFTLLAGRRGPLVVGVSGAAGLPPLLAVAFYAGASPMGYGTFTAACLAGRTARFAVVALAPGLF